MKERLLFIGSSLILGVALSGCVLIHNQKQWYSALYYSSDTKLCEKEVLSHQQNVPDKLEQRVLNKTNLARVKNSIRIFSSEIQSKTSKKLEFIQLTICSPDLVHSFMIVDGGNVEGYLLEGISDTERAALESKAHNGIQVLKTEEDLIQKINAVIRGS